MSFSWRERLSNAWRNTEATRAWKRDLLGAVLLVPASYVILRLLSSPDAALEEVLAITAAVAVGLLLIPLLELLWNFSVAHLRLEMENLENEAQSTPTGPRLKIVCQPARLVGGEWEFYNLKILNEGPQSAENVVRYVQELDANSIEGLDDFPAPIRQTGISINANDEATWMGLEIYKPNPEKNDGRPIVKVVAQWWLGVALEVGEHFTVEWKVTARNAEAAFARVRVRRDSTAQAVTITPLNMTPSHAKAPTEKKKVEQEAML